MTAILAITDGKKVWMAGDSFIGGETVKDLCKSPKVYKVGPIGIGLCGMVRQELIVEKTIRNLIEKEKVEVSHEWIKFELPNILVKELNENMAIVEEKSQATLGSSAYLIGFDGVIYYLDEDFGIWDSQRNIAGIGAGRSWALGALEVILDKSPELKREDQLKEALKVANRWSPWVLPPYVSICV